MNDIEALMTTAKSVADYEKTIKDLRKMERALAEALDLEALGIARCLEQELVKIKTSMTKATVYNCQLQHIIRKHTDE